MAPFEVLYEHRCCTPLNWIELGEKVIFEPDLVEEDEATVRRIQDNLKATKSRQETYANKRCRPLEFDVGDHVYLRVSPMKGVKRFWVKGKLASRYIGPCPILEKCGTMAYKLDLPPCGPACQPSCPNVSAQIMRQHIDRGTTAFSTATLPASTTSRGYKRRTPGRGFFLSASTTFMPPAHSSLRSLSLPLFVDVQHHPDT
jgi:hypothetical protein